MPVDTDEAISSSRPRIRRDVLYTQTPQGVLFHDADSGFHLKAKSAYQLSTLIIPHLTGTLAVQSICEGMPPDKSRMVIELVRTLYQRGFARAVANSRPEPDLPAAVAERFATQINYVDHYVDDATARFCHFRTARVAVLGSDRVAHACALSLVRNGAGAIGVGVRPEGADDAEFADLDSETDELRAAGCPPAVAELPAGDVLDWAALAGFDLVVVTPGPDGPRQMFALLSEGVPAGKMLVPAWLCGDRAVIGPLTKSGRQGCWMCATLRAAANADGGAAADLWSRIVLSAPADGGSRRPSGPLASMIGNLLGYEVFRILTGCLPAETDGRVILQELDSLDTTTEPVLPHPGCPFCRRAPGSETPGPAIPGDVQLPDVRPQPSPTTLDQDSSNMLSALQARQDLIQPHTGLFRRFDDERLVQTPLKISVLEMSAGPRRSTPITAFDLHTVVGARLRALGRAAIVYVDAMTPLTGVVDTAGLRRQQIPGVQPDGLDTWSGVPVARSQIRDWVRARSMLSGDLVAVPAAAVRPSGPENDKQWFAPGVGGAGAGPTLPDAVASGLLSAVAFQTLRAVLRRRRPATMVDRATVRDDAELTFLFRSSTNMGVELELLDLTDSGPGAPCVVLARLQESRRTTPIWAIGSELSWQAAAVAAGRDAIGQLQLLNDPAAPVHVGVSGAAHLGGLLLADFEPATIACTSERPAPLQLCTSWTDVTDRLRKSAVDPLVVPTGSADLRANGLETVRVLLSRKGSP